MVIVYELTRPMEDFPKVFHNGAQVLERIDATECAYFWHKEQEVLIYDGTGVCLYSCCWTSAFNRNYITEVFNREGLRYYYSIDYDAIEQEIKKRICCGSVGH